MDILCTYDQGTDSDGLATLFWLLEILMLKDTMMFQTSLFFFFLKLMEQS